jgi:hypothetical protein
MGSSVDTDSAAEQSTGSVILGAGGPVALSVAGATKMPAAEIAPSGEGPTLRVSSLTAQHLNRHVRIGSRGNGDGVQGRLFAVRHERAWSILELSVMNQSVTIQIPHAGDSVVLTLLDGEPAEAAN